MEARDDDFGTTMREIVQQRSGEAATYTHIECKIGGLERAAMGIQTLIGWLKEHPQDSATYIFVNKAYLCAALNSVEIEEEMTTNKQVRGKLLITTYHEYIRRIEKPQENEGKIVFVMDMGFGVRTGEMALAAIALLHSLQEFLRGDKTGTTVLWISVSYLGEELLSKASGRRVDGLRLPNFNQPRLCHQDRAHEKADGLQRPDNNWQSAAVDRILEEVIKEATWPVAIAFVMSIEDAYLIRDELATHPQYPSPAMDLIHDWKGSPVAEPVAEKPDAQPQQLLRIVWIDPEVSIVCPIEDLKAVVVAPVLKAYAFDMNTTSVVEKEMVCDHLNALASSILGTGSQEMAVHMVKGFSHPVPATNQRRVGFEEERAELNTASNRDFWCLNLATHTVAGDYQYPGIISVVVAPQLPKIDEAVRRLDLWHLVDRSDLPPGVDPRAPRPPSLLAGPAGAYARFNFNIHCAVLLAYVHQELPSSVKQVLIDLAALITQDPRTVFDYRGKAKGPREHMDIIRGLGHRAGSAIKQCHKGLLWQSLAYLTYFRNLTADAAWGLDDWPASGLDGVAVHHVLARLLDRSSRWGLALNFSKQDRTLKLSSKDFELVEAILVSAFPFNLMRVHVEDVGYFGRDLTSDVILEEEAKGETVHWEMLKREARESGHGLIMAIHSHLWMDIADDDLRVYRAIGVTAISAPAFQQGLTSLGINHFSSLRPFMKPELRCRVPRSKPQPKPEGNSSQISTSTNSSST